MRPALPGRLTLGAVLAAAACAGGSDDVTDTDTDADTEVAACPAAGAPVQLAAGVSAAGTEGVTFGPDGTLYVTTKDRLVTIDTAGTVTDLAAANGSIGAAWWKGDVWVAVTKDEAGDDAPALLQVSPAGVVTRHPTPEIGAPNFLTPTPWGTLLVADDYDTRIFEVTAAGVVSVWAEDVPSPNGMAFTPDGATLWVASTFTMPPPLSRIPVTDGEAGTREAVHTFAAGSSPDGVAMGVDGEVLVALNSLSGSVVVWRDGGVETLADGLPTPASLAFGRGAFDPCSVVITSLFGNTVQLLPTGIEGFVPPWAEE
ncbi:MAG: SMP-30/gluconolactonase/LRE family protein [Alphaproteobacteria bacterium]|nr:SMP-30/gluconolactonase/LRE family protein [Alphaproteobacteria bacterium]